MGFKTFESGITENYDPGYDMTCMILHIFQKRCQSL
jgi:hypothetical protein